jgi:hypothetical protein
LPPHPHSRRNDGSNRQAEVDSGIFQTDLLAEEAVEAERAREILAFLADGVDPYSGERFPIESPYQHPDTVRALYMAIAGLPRGRQAPKPADEARAGQPWSDAEDQELRNAIAAGMQIRAIARAHKRTDGAIESRLVRLGLFESRDDARQFGRALNQGE